MGQVRLSILSQVLCLCWHCLWLARERYYLIKEKQLRSEDLGKSLRKIWQLDIWVCLKICCISKWYFSNGEHCSQPSKFGSTLFSDKPIRDWWKFSISCGFATQVLSAETGILTGLVPTLTLLKEMQVVDKWCVLVCFALHTISITH